MNLWKPSNLSATLSIKSLSCFDVRNSALHGARKINMKQRPVKAIDNHFTGTFDNNTSNLLNVLIKGTTRFTVVDGIVDGVNLLRILCSLTSELLLIGIRLGSTGGRIRTTNLSHAENGLPTMVKLISFRWISKPGARQRTFSPS